MSDYYTVMAATSPDYWAKMDEDPQADPTMADSAGSLDATYGANMTRVTSPVAASAGAILFPSTDTIQTPTTNIFQALYNVTVACWLRRPIGSTGFVQPFRTFGGGDYFRAAFLDNEQLWFTIEEESGVKNYQLTTNNALPIDDNWYFFVFRFRGQGVDTADVWRNGVMLNTGSTTAAAVDRLSNNFTNVIDIHPLSHGDVAMDQLAIWQRALTDQEIIDLYAARNVGVTPQPQIIPVRLRAFRQSAAQSIPVRLRSMRQSPAQTIPVRLQALDPGSFGDTVEKWGALVQLDNVDIFDQLTGALQITAEENQSGLCNFTIVPPAGAINLDDYERKSVKVSFLRKNSSGVTIATLRRFTGTTTTATYDPDAGTMSIEATNDLQGKFDNLSRDMITTLIGGHWSEYVFDDTAQGWSYAEQRLKTVRKCVYIDPYGALKVADWAAKATADVALTDAHRFNNTLRLRRNSRRDLISRNTINLDFRFTRLRHREMLVVFTFSPGFCGYLNGEAALPQKSAIFSAADSNGWTRTSDITFEDLPETQANVCGGSNWVANDATASLCLGATWKAARRWAQTVTEEYAIAVVSEDIEAAIGTQPVSEDYGVEAIYDAKDWELIDDFDGPATSMVLSSKTDDYQLDADQVTAGGRTDLAVAITTALEKAATEMFSRARGNRVSLTIDYDPAITLAATASVTTPSLTTRAKVYRYTENWNFDTGEPTISLELAVSRHGGSGLGNSDPLTPPSQPDQPQETTTPRRYNIGVHSGGTTVAGADDPEWDGWITNAYAAARTDPDNLYRERFALRMPEIEAAARNESIAQAASTNRIDIPQDPLTLSY